MSLLSDIFFGDFSNERMPLTKKEKKITAEIMECEARVKEQMMDKEIAGELLSKLELAYGKYENILSEQCFEFGFYFGARLMMEIFGQNMV